MMLRTLSAERLLVAAATLACFATANAQSEAEQAVKAVVAANEKVTGFRADIEGRDNQGGQEQVTTSALTVSKLHGWKVKSSGATQGDFEFFCDFKSFVQYYPAERKAYKNTAANAEAAEMFRKPVSDMNPLPLLDPRSLTFKGKTEFEGQPVYRFEGTTSTQLLPQGRPVERKMELWISATDGLPRKSIEKIGAAEGATVFRNVIANPELAAADFQFVAPPGVSLIDADQELKMMEEQAKKAQSVQSRKAAYTSATQELTSPTL